MTYSSGGLIQATDYNGFVSTTVGSNLNDIWGTGSGDKGWGQTPLSTVSAGGIVTATNWASLVNILASAGSQTSTTLTSRSAPTTGQTIGILANVAADLTSVTTNRGNAAASGTTSSTWTGNVAKTAATGTTNASWTIVWTQTVTFASANAARYFWNAGGLIRLDMSKSSTGTDKDPDWNTFVGTVGTLYFSGRVNGAAQTIAGTSYTGLTRVGGSGTPSPNLTTTGWYTLTPGAAATTIWQLNSTVSPYSGDYIRITAGIDSGSTQITFTITWYSAGLTGAGETNNISGGTDTASPYTSFGTAPAVLCRYIPPSTTYLTNSWGTPTITSSVGTSGYAASYLIVAGGGGGGSSIGGGGGAGGYVSSSITLTPNGVYDIVIGAGGGANANGANTSLSSNSTAISTAIGGGGGGYNTGAFTGTGGLSGGSGGGGAGHINGGTGGGSGTAGQGYSGGTSTQPGVFYGGGGGGASGGGGSPGAGSGIANPISGSTIGQFSGGTYYICGGGAAGGSDGGGPNGGALGGGGNGGCTPGTSSSPGQANTGGGGGGGGGGWNGNGGSGAAVLSIPTAKYSGTYTGTPTITTSGSNTLLTFTSSGSYTA